MSKGHEFVIDMRQIVEDGLKFGGDYKNRALFHCMFEMANEANKLGIDGYRIKNMYMIPYPDYGFGLASKYRIVMELDNTETTGNVIEPQLAEANK